jgi:hypothetical protein
MDIYIRISVSHRHMFRHFGKDYSDRYVQLQPQDQMWENSYVENAWREDVNKREICNINLV